MMNQINLQHQKQQFMAGYPDRLLESHLSFVMQIPPTKAGLIPALGALHQILTAANKVWLPPGLTEVISAIHSVEMDLSTSEITPSQLRASPDPDQVSPSYRLLLIVANGGSHIELNEVVKAILGATFLVQIVSGKPLASYRAKSLVSLLTWPTFHSKFRSSWRNFSLSLTTSPSHIAACAAKSNVNTIYELGLWLKGVVTEASKCVVPSLTQTQLQPHAIECDAADLGLLDRESAPAQPTINDIELSDNSATEGADSFAEAGSIVRWHWQRAVKGSAIGSAGLTDWNVLTPAELRKSIQVIREGLNAESDMEVRFSIAAVLSLATALPIKLLVTAPLSQNDDLWIDIDCCEIIWNLDKLVKRNPVSPVSVPNGFNPESYVRLPLPQDVGSKLASLPRQGETLGELLFPRIGVEQVISRYGSFLRGPSADPRKPYAARFAFSLGAAIAHTTSDSIAAAYGSLDFRHVAPSEPYYLCLPNKRIYDALDATYRWLGLGALGDKATHGYIGSPFVPHRDLLHNAITALTRQLDELNTGIGPRSSLNHVAERFNRRTVLTAALFVLLSGERGTNISRRSYQAIYGHQDIAIISDKETDVSISRPIPLTTDMRNLLDDLRKSVSGIATRAQREGHVVLARKLDLIATGGKPYAPAFFLLKQREGKGYSLSPLQTEDIRQCIEGFGIALNAGRHYLITQLSSVENPPYLKRILSGHGSKAGQPFHYASGLTPASALSELRIYLQNIHAVLGFTYPTSETRGSSRTHLPVRLRPTAASKIENKSIAAFVRFDPRNAGRQPEMFPLNFAASLRHAQELRESFLSHTNDIEPGAAILISLVLIDGIIDPEVVPMLWDILTNRETIFIGNTIWAEVTLNSGRARVFSPLPPTVIALSRFVRGNVKASFQDVCNQAILWVCGTHRRVTWPTAPMAFLDSLCGLSHVLYTYEYPCWLTTAQSRELCAATLSLSSIARCVSKLPLLSTEKVKKRSGRRTHSEIQSIRSVTKILAECANTDSNIGEDRKRKSKLLSSIENLLNLNCMIFPMASAVIDYVVAECKSSPAHGNPIEVSTIYSYVISMHQVLESLRMEHPLEFSRKDWLEYEGQLLQAQKKGHDDAHVFDPSPLRRFALYWLSCGAAVPTEIFANTSTINNPRARWSTASFIFWDHERTEFRRKIALSYPRGTLQSEMAKLYCDLIAATPLRAREANYIRLIDFDDDHSLTITSSGFSHLKNTDVSRRSVLLSSQIANSLGHFKKRILDASPSRTYFFFHGKEPAQDDEFVGLIEQVAQELVRTTGEPSVRRHSLRGAAENRIVFSEIDEMLRSQCNAPDGISDEQLQVGSYLDWQGIVAAAKEAGHHPLTALSTYMTFWPIMGRFLNLLRLKELWPGSGYASWAGIPPSTVRVVKHRSSSNGQSALSGWRLLSREIQLQEYSTAYKGLAPNSNFIADAVPDTEPEPYKPSELFARRIWLCGLLLTGFSETSASDITQVEIDDHLRKTVARFSQKQRPKHSGVSHENFMRTNGFQIAMRLAEIADLAVFKTALRSLDASAKRASSSTESELVDSLQSIAQLIDPDWFISLLPEVEGLPINSVARLRRLHPALLIKEPSKHQDRRYRFTVSTHSGLTFSPRSTGITTLAYITLLGAAIALLEAEHRS